MKKIPSYKMSSRLREFFNSAEGSDDDLESILLSAFEAMTDDSNDFISAYTDLYSWDSLEDDDKGLSIEEKEEIYKSQLKDIYSIGESIDKGWRDAIFNQFLCIIAMDSLKNNIISKDIDGEFFNYSDEKLKEYLATQFNDYKKCLSEINDATDTVILYNGLYDYWDLLHTEAKNRYEIFLATKKNISDIIDNKNPD